MAWYWQMFYSKDALSMDALNMDGKYGMMLDVIL